MEAKILSRIPASVSSRLALDLDFRDKAVRLCLNVGGKGQIEKQFRAFESTTKANKSLERLDDPKLKASIM